MLLGLMLVVLRSLRVVGERPLRKTTHGRVPDCGRPSKWFFVWGGSHLVTARRSEDVVVIPYVYIGKLYVISVSVEYSASTPAPSLPS